MARPDVKSSEAGFTLIEVLVALSVFSLAVMALMNLAAANTRTAGIVGSRVIAGVVAENRAIEAATGMEPLPIGKSSGADSEAGRLWRWTREISRTEDRSILRIDLSVMDESGARPAAKLTVFRGAP